MIADEKEEEGENWRMGGLANAKDDRKQITKRNKRHIRKSNGRFVEFVCL